MTPYSIAPRHTTIAPTSFAVVIFYVSLSNSNRRAAKLMTLALFTQLSISSNVHQSYLTHLRARARARATLRVTGTTTTAITVITMRGGSSDGKDICERRGEKNSALQVDIQGLIGGLQD